MFNIPVSKPVSSNPTIIADERIPYVREAFQSLGTLIPMPGREMNAITIRDADILLVRSITRVDEALIGKSRVRYVATASTGFDHIDTDFLNDRDIHFFTAAGCNANSVSEYIAAAIAELCNRFKLRFNDLTLGVIGAGKIGTRAADKARAIGMNVLYNDPPLKDETGDDAYLPLDTILARSDIVTLHVPLTYGGHYPTANMVNEDFLAEMKPASFIINTSRGAVVDEDALLDRLSGRHLHGAVLDVWRDEPAINTELLKRTEIGTPHIAGHSVDGQVNATIMVYNDLCSFLKRKPDWRPEGLPVPDQPVLSLDGCKSMQEEITKALLHAYPIYYDDQNLRQIIDADNEVRPALVDKVRNERYIRREFDSFRITGYDDTTFNVLTKLGFKT